MIWSGSTISRASRAHAEGRFDGPFSWNCPVILTMTEIQRAQFGEARVQTVASILTEFFISFLSTPNSFFKLFRQNAVLNCTYNYYKYQRYLITFPPAHPGPAALIFGLDARAGRKLSLSSSTRHPRAMELILRSGTRLFFTSPAELIATQCIATITFSESAHGT